MAAQAHSPIADVARPHAYPLAYLSLTVAAIVSPVVPFDPWPRSTPI
jgi:hypothetical protein